MSEVTLVYPCSDTNKYDIELDKRQVGDMPFGLLSIATYLEQNGHNVNLLDLRAYDKKQGTELLLKKVKRSDIIGFSVMTVQVKHALKLTKIIKGIDKKNIVIWGGIHPTLFPKQTLEHEDIDYICVGEGEYTLKKLLDYFNNSHNLNKIAGLGYKEKKHIKIRKSALALNLEDLPDPKYGLLDIKKYLDKILLDGSSVKSIGIQTSRGCPYRCAFCTNTILEARRWRPFDTSRILDFTEELINTYKLEHIMISDDYFFGNQKRATAIAKEFIERKFDIKWEANIRSNNFNKHQLNDKQLPLFKKSGLFCLRMGLESGSNRILQVLKKDITIEDSVNAIKQCGKYDIIPLGYFMIGIPDETNNEIIQTFKFILKLYDINPKSHIIVPGLFRPYPGGELYNECIKAGFKEPHSLEEWVNVPLNESYINAEDLPWIKNPSLVKDLREYYIWTNAIRQNPKAAYKLFLMPLAFIGRTRFNYSFFKFRYDVRLFRSFKKFRGEWRKE